MRLDSISTASKPLQNSNHNKEIASKSKTVEQERSRQEDLFKDKFNNNTKKIDTVVDKMNEFIEPLQANIKFEYHEKLQEYYVTLIDKNTDEVIKEIPSKKMLDMYAEMAELMGFIIDEKI
ncbi:flagellar protein FlaG [Oceanobacillus limi]|uniref:Flagellar protein FlaG n=1 Tax=Oceanobacillus limi TaxID=930131 RepID=A0A1I0BSL7_9BACI|nr:flagellar protein FlaG [Oceanobacillus limi]SET09633.1 flagellar protein FlaG [Oceanobacillus limi]